MSEPQMIWVEVAYALPHMQRLERLEIPVGASAREVVLAASFDEQFPDLDTANCPLGIFGKPVADGQCVQQGDRVEIYRPLVNDPREHRRELAAKGKNMGAK
jgi:putative ubiquitin-RnfH superfamily antitoxin RatB of RatAB toxin-antitoxin module